MGLRDWVSEMDSFLVGWNNDQLGFNGAPRLGLGDGALAMGGALFYARLQWGSETGSRRWNGWPVTKADEWVASMGLRDWVSEMGAGAVLAGQHEEASMGLRDWVSEMASRCAQT